MTKKKSIFTKELIKKLQKWYDNKTRQETGKADDDYYSDYIDLNDASDEAEIDCEISEMTTCCGIGEISMKGGNEIEDILIGMLSCGYKSYITVQIKGQYEDKLLSKCKYFTKVNTHKNPNTSNTLNTYICNIMR